MAGELSRLQFQYVDLAGFLRGVEISYTPGGEYLPSIDGSSVYGFRSIEDSDLLLVGDKSTLRDIPWQPGAKRILSFVRLPDGGEFDRDPRSIASRLVEYVKESHGFDVMVGAEVEFFLFDDVQLDIVNEQAGLGYEVSSIEQPWTGPTFAVTKKAYHAVSPVDSLLDYRVDLAMVMEELGYPVDVSHHEVAIAQIEAGIRAGDPLHTGDGVITLKWAARNIAIEHGLTAVFLPKPVYGDNGSGMHLHISLWQSGKNLFAGEDGISQLARYFIGGLLEHAESLAALVAPTTNSYRRLVPGYEAPVYTAWGYRNRSAMVRIPAARSEDSVRIEYRTPDPSANPYLAITATIMAGLDGIRRRIDPGDPLEKNAYTLTREEMERLGVRMLPSSLDRALDALESDNEYLKPVMSGSALAGYIEVKRREAEAVRLRPHPYEYYLYGGL